jgi:uncharacterized protein YuzE
MMGWGKKMNESIKFEVETPLNMTISVSEGYWKYITTVKHPYMRNKEENVVETLKYPESVRRSRTDENVYLFYRQIIYGGKHLPSMRGRESCRRIRDHCIHYPSNKGGTGNMEKISVVFNRLTNTLDVWFDDPEKEWVSEETGGDVILKKDRNGRVIGFEKLNVRIAKDTPMPVEVLSI